MPPKRVVDKISTKIPQKSQPIEDTGRYKYHFIKRPDPFAKFL